MVSAASVHSGAAVAAAFEVVGAGADHDAAQPPQPLLLSPSLWNRFAVAPSSSSSAAPPSRIAVSIAPAHRTSGGGSARRSTRLQSALRPMTCWAQRDEGSAEETLLAKLPPDVAARLGLGRQRSKQRDATGLFIQPHTPVGLSVAYFAATSESGYDLSQGSQEVVVEQLDGQILHQDDLVRLRLGCSILSLRVVMTEPVLQGRFDADRTQILMTVDDVDDEALPQPPSQVGEVASGDVSTASTSGLTTLTTESGFGRDGDDDEADGDASDAFSIDESYLARSVLQDFAGGGEAFLSSPLRVLPSTAKLLAGEVQREREREPLARKRRRCLVRQLDDYGVLQSALSDWRERRMRSEVGEEPEDVDEEDVILLGEKDLAQIGAFDGDWAVAEVEDHDAARLVRLFCSADLATVYAENGAPAAWMSPMLHQNLFGLDHHAHQAGPMTLTLRPLGTRPARGNEQQAPVARTCPVTLPFADNVSIARVASPYSVDRAYQGLFLEALRTYFEGRQRICKEGDLIAVAIEAGKARFVQAAATDASVEDVHEFRLPGADGLQKTAVVHFKVSALTSELVAPTKASVNGGGAIQHEDEASLSLRAQLGQLGCVVDPNVTKMVQTGVEKCRIADASRWLGVVSDTPERPRQPRSADGSAASEASPLTAEGSAYATLLKLLGATLQPDAGRFGLHLSVLLKGARGSGKRTVVRWVAQAAGVQLVEIDCFDLVSDTDARTEGTLRARFDKAADCAPAILLLRNIDALARKSQALETGQEPAMATVLQKCVEELRAATATNVDGAAAAKGARALPVAVFGTTSDADKCPAGVLGCFKHEVAFQAPNEAERLQMLRIALNGAALSPDVDLKSLATQTAALVAADLVNLVSRAKLASVARIRKEVGEEGVSYTDADLVLSGVVLTGGDFEQALNKARSSYSDSIGAPKIPNVTWDDVGGLANVKSDILDTIQLPLEHPELFSDGLKKRSGILLYGPPGTGKTLLAKAVATSCSLNFFSVKGPELLNMYIGESEANVRRVFQRARDAKPCVIFFDELDSVAPKRGNQGDSGGVMDRIVSQLLAELDGMAGSSEGTDVFVIGATNRPDLLDPALLRPGRFDRMLYLSVSETHAAQLNILQALTRKFKLDPDVGDLSVIAEQCPFNLTGADFYALCSDAMLKAMTRKASEVDASIAAINATPGAKAHPHPLTPQYYLAEMAKPDEIEVKVNRADFEAALRELVPSVSEQEMAHYREVQAKFSAPKPEAAATGAKQDIGAAHASMTATKVVSQAGSSLAPIQERSRISASAGPAPGSAPSQGPKTESGRPGDESLANGQGEPGTASTASDPRPPSDESDATASAKGKGKENAQGKAKGKGKAIAGDGDSNGDDDADGDGEDSTATEQRRRAKGKGKAT
ncbi:peroxisomal assembly protein [Thecaphora frezii]